MTIKAMNSYATLIDLQVNGYGGIDFSAKILLSNRLSMSAKFSNQKELADFLHSSELSARAI